MLTYLLDNGGLTTHLTLLMWQKLTLTKIRLLNYWTFPNEGLATQQIGYTQQMALVVLERVRLGDIYLVPSLIILVNLDFSLFLLILFLYWTLNLGSLILIFVLDLVSRFNKSVWLLKHIYTLIKTVNWCMARHTYECLFVSINKTWFGPTEIKF